MGWLFFIYLSPHLFREFQYPASRITQHNAPEIPGFVCHPNNNLMAIPVKQHPIPKPVIKAIMNRRFPAFSDVGLSSFFGIFPQPLNDFKYFMIRNSVPTNIPIFPFPSLMESHEPILIYSNEFLLLEHSATRNIN